MTVELPYFAYGSNLDPDQMRKRCPGAQALGKACLHGYRLCFPRYSSLWHGGVASIRVAPDDAVWGVLFQLTEVDKKALDYYEGIPYHYTTNEIEVSFKNTTKKALTYFAVSQQDHIPPSDMYLKGIIKGAKYHCLPKEYIKRLKHFT